MNTTDELKTLEETGTIQAKHPVLAKLPAFPLFIASKFVAKPDVKHTISVISVSTTGKTVAIQATNGHIAFRFKFPTTEKFYAKESFLVNPRAFDKKVPKAHSIIFNENNYAAFHDSNMNWSESRAWKDFSGVENYPNLEQLYPSDFSNEFKQSFSFNASYLKLISQTVSTYCQKNYYNDPVITFNGNHSNTAFLITAKVSLKEFEHLEEFAPKLEFLLMPIQIRE